MNLRTIKMGLLSLVVPAGGLTYWWIASLDSTSVYFPPLKTILTTAREVWLSERFSADLMPSVGRLFAGLTLAIIFGVLVGLVLGRSATMYRLTQPMIEFVRALPPPLLIPFGMAVIGTGSSMKIMVIAVGSIAPILLNTIDGVRSIDPPMLDVGRAYRFSRWQRMRYLILPAASPQIFAGIRIGLAVGVILMVISEMLASTNGVGYFIIQAQRSFAIPEMWSGIIVLGLLGITLSTAFTLIESRVLSWHRGAKAAALSDQ